MNLTYRGVAYSTSTPHIAAVPTEQTGTFLGARFTQKRYSIAHRQLQGQELTFLGRHYSR